jgi:hypothetical protein
MKLLQKYLANTPIFSTVKKRRITPFQDDFQAFLVSFPLHTGIVRHGLCAVSMARWTGGGGEDLATCCFLPGNHALLKKKINFPHT